MFKKLVKALSFSSTTKNIEEVWLSQSTDLVELERRIKMIDRGQAPWQKSLYTGER